MTVTKSKATQKVAIVGSGMAGLATAHILRHDVHQRYSVTVFESVRMPQTLTFAGLTKIHQGECFSLDSASISVQDESREVVDRIDVPMRAFAEGYYKNLIRM